MGSNYFGDTHIGPLYFFSIISWTFAILGGDAIGEKIYHGRFFVVMSR
jgi:hypothetical protein